jgi:hypothetical protein
MSVIIESIHDTFLSLRAMPLITNIFFSETTFSDAVNRRKIIKVSEHKRENGQSEAEAS